MDDIGYLTREEMMMNRGDVNLQIALGLRSCKTMQDACELLDQVRRHERFVLSRKGLLKRVAEGQ